MAKINLTDRKLKSLKPAKKGQRYDVRDSKVAGLLVRVTENGTRSFMLQARYPGSRQPARRVLGVYPTLSLEKARSRASKWVSLIKEGVDPKIAEDAARRAALRAQQQTFAVVAEDFIAHCKGEGERKADEVERDLRVEFIKPWGDWPVTSITADDVRKVIQAKKADGKKAQAHNLFGTIRRLFNWAIGVGGYGLDNSPCDRLQPRKLIGKRATRDRVLGDDELRAFWTATGKIEYPYGPLFRLLALTIQRRSEVAEALRPEIDDKRALWVIPASRMKSEAPHVVPLAPMAAEILAGLPEFTKGDHLFTTTFGEKPVNGFSKAKKRLDALMLTELRAAAERAGRDPEKVVLKPWVIHDLRRTGRAHLSALPIPDMIRELVIAHAKKDLHKVYDQFDHLPAKRDALALWEDRLRSIVEPQPETPTKPDTENVIAFSRARA
jgi:integrase